MAIYSCNIKSVGKKTHATGTAGAHMRYIARDGANADIAAHHIPQAPKAAQQWMNAQETAERANARMISKIMVALPVELSEPERNALVRDYVQNLTHDRIPWYFAIHQSGEDAHNPHAHIVLRDRDIETGKRVLMLSDGATDRVKAGLPENGVEWIRERWEHVCNQHLEQAGQPSRVDRRSLEAQGVTREPTIHLGASGQRVDEFADRPQSKAREENMRRKHYRDEVPYPEIDQGRTRKERNAEIINFNASRMDKDRIEQIQKLLGEQGRSAASQVPLKIAHYFNANAANNRQSKPLTMAGIMCRASVDANNNRMDALRDVFNHSCKAKPHAGDNALLGMMKGVSDASGRIQLACQAINAKYSAAIDAIASNQYFTHDQRQAQIAALRQQQKAEISATRQRIQREERQQVRVHQKLNLLLTLCAVWRIIIVQFTFL